MPISLSLNLTKLERNRFFKGKKGTYANIMLWEVEPGSESAEYGDYLVKQQGEKGDKMPILGNAKNVDFKNNKKGGNRGQRRDRDDDDDDDDEIPF